MSTSAWMACSLRSKSNGLDLGQQQKEPHRRHRAMEWRFGRFKGLRGSRFAKPENALIAFIYFALVAEALH